jgi:hypothetical protein
MYVKTLFFEVVYEVKKYLQDISALTDIKKKKIIIIYINIFPAM